MNDLNFFTTMDTRVGRVILVFIFLPHSARVLLLLQAPGCT